MTTLVSRLSGYMVENERCRFFQFWARWKGSGFVQFVHRHAAEVAINQISKPITKDS
ncbi:hypothetical protein F5X99DRAFT_391893 [Biscogniauxia marginata]|nr:hypothetical protein F5X99DRAFT_391893 [Biscogniauxia marginata]